MNNLTTLEARVTVSSRMHITIIYYDNSRIEALEILELGCENIIVFKSQRLESI